MSPHAKNMGARSIKIFAKVLAEYSADDDHLARLPGALRRMADDLEIAALRAKVIVPYVALVRQGARLVNVAGLLRARANNDLLDQRSMAALGALGMPKPSFRTLSRWMNCYLKDGFAGLLPGTYPPAAQPAQTPAGLKRKQMDAGRAMQQFAQKHGGAA